MPCVVLSYFCNCPSCKDYPTVSRYEKSSRFMKEGYERDFLRYLQSLLAEVERRIRRGHARLALSQAQQNAGVRNLHWYLLSICSCFPSNVIQRFLWRVIWSPMKGNLECQKKVVIDIFFLSDSWSIWEEWGEGQSPNREDRRPGCSGLYYMEMME